MLPGQDSVSLPTAALLPNPWQSGPWGDDFAVYNPAIVQHRGRLLMAYRVDFGRGRGMQRKIGLCELDATFTPVPDSVRPLSDRIESCNPYHYDPRFLLYQDRLFIHYNNNTQSRPNQIFLIELDSDTLAPRTPARPLRLAGPRQAVEKNWMLFEHAGDLLAVYQIAPHTILRLDLAGTGAVECHPFYTTDWDVSAYADRFGAPRGGTPPVRQGQIYLSFFHSRYPISPLRGLLRIWPDSAENRLPRYVAAIERRQRRPLDQMRYVAGVYAFDAAPPFRPRRMAESPILRPEAEAPYTRRRRRRNPSADGIVYPCGALPWADGRWLVSYGVHDERCCLRFVNLPGPNEDWK